MKQLIVSILVILAAANVVTAQSGSASVPLFENLGSLHRPITTDVPLAQRYFDQGLRLTYGFNHEEAIHAFREAARLDPKCAMCSWGVALAFGPNINAPMDSAQERQAFAAIGEARKRVASTSAVERALIDALAARYNASAADARTAHDSAYARAMGDVARRFPDDVDVATLYGEALMDLRPWDQWTPAGEPQPGTLEVVRTLERAIQLNPSHPGACHYYIHAVEASTRPERALPCAERLADLMPGAGHLVHMPAHIYMRLGMYEKATEHNRHAARTDVNYLADRHPTGMYPFYYAHNLHFLWAAASMEGRREEALGAARQLAQQVPIAMVQQLPFTEFLSPTLYYAFVRFGMWDEALKEPAPPADLKFTTGMWHYARAVALAQRRQLADARRERTALAGIVAGFPADGVVGLQAGKPLLTVALGVVDGEIAGAAGDTDGALQAFNRALAAESTLRYDEPPAWHVSVRQSLGTLLLKAGRAAEAERVFGEDLRLYPQNGWSLRGLAEAQRAQKKTELAAQTEERLRAAWRRADIPHTQ